MAGNLWYALYDKDRLAYNLQTIKFRIFLGLDNESACMNEQCKVLVVLGRVQDSLDSRGKNYRYVVSTEQQYLVVLLTVNISYGLFCFSCTRGKKQAGRHPGRKI